MFDGLVVTCPTWWRGTKMCLGYERICTSHIKEQNLTVRMQNRRLIQLTNGFSKKWANLKAALALHLWTHIA